VKGSNLKSTLGYSFKDLSVIKISISINKWNTIEGEVCAPIGHLSFVWQILYFGTQIQKYERGIHWGIAFTEAMGIDFFFP